MDSDPDGEVALTIAAESEEELVALFDEAVESLPSASFIVSVPEGDGAWAGSFAERAGPDRLLCVKGEAGSPDNLTRISSFLEGSGYRWASDLRPSVLRERLADRTRSLRNGGGSDPEKLSGFVRGLSEFTDLDAMLEGALRSYLEIVGCHAGSVYVWDERAETLVLRAAEGPDRDQRLGLRQGIGEGLAGWVAQKKEPLLVTDTRDVRWLRERKCRRYSSFSCIAAPVMHGEQLFGVVCLTMPDDGEQFEAGDLHLLQVLSQKLGSLVRPLSLLSEMRYFNDRLVQAFKSCSDLVVEKDKQVEAMRVLSSDILNGVPLGVIAYDREMNVCFANAVAERLFGLPAESATGRSVCSLAEGMEMAADAWREKLLGVVARDHQGFRIERVAHRLSGGTRILEVNGAPLHDSDGACIGGVLTVQDVTEDAEMEAKLSAAQRLALMGQIAAKVAHELNNPLDGILRFLGLAMRTFEKDPEKARHYLEESRKGLLRMSHIVGQLLAFSRRHRGVGETVGIRQILEDALALYDERARSIGAEVRVDVPRELPPCASEELYGVFSNVIKNALDAMAGSDGERLLTIRGGQENGLIKVTFADTGPGVPEDVRQNVFEPFVTTKRDGTGTGLGLATCRDVLDRLGGAIRLCPSERGATFEIALPVRTEQ
ncbi:MAG: ATP-binding protein [Candidatus Brocadiaceae bacterium]|jgi:PAS domain S-box-containing protein